MSTIGQSSRLVKHLFGKNSPVPTSPMCAFGEPQHKINCWIGEFPSEMLGGKFAVIFQFRVGVLGDRIMLKAFSSHQKCLREFKSLEHWFVDLSSSAKAAEFDYIYDNYLQFDVDELEGTGE